METQAHAIYQRKRKRVQEKIEDMRQREDHNPQRSENWKQKRKNMLTGTDVPSLLMKTPTICEPYVNDFNLLDQFDFKHNEPCNPYQKAVDVFSKKCGLGEAFSGNEATRWGNKYEPIATLLYEAIQETNVHEFNLVHHPTIPWLGASPDGMTDEGKLIEIKCPYRRKNVSGLPSIGYWIQMQVQLEVCDVDVCDFMECEFSEYQYQDEYLHDQLEDTLERKGVLIIKSTGEYMYPPLHTFAMGTDLTIEELNEDMPNEQLKWARNEVTPDDQILYWKLIFYAITPVQRRRGWFQSILPNLQKEYEHIQNYHRHGKIPIEYKRHLDRRAARKRPRRCYHIHEEEEEEERSATPTSSIVQVREEMRYFFSTKKYEDE